jgi:hypothetical protein
VTTENGRAGAPRRSQRLVRVAHFGAEWLELCVVDG